MVKLRQQFRDVLLVSILETISCFVHMYMYCDEFDVAQIVK